MLNKRIGLVALMACLVAGSAEGKDVSVHVDAHCGPWMQSVNPKLSYGLGNNRPPAMIWAANLLAGSKIVFSANGQTTTVSGGGSFGPNGQQEWTDDHGGALFPSHYMDAKKIPIHLNELVGAFVDADGTVVGKPFAVGEKAQITVPQGAAAIALGINDDNYSDNSGGLDVQVHIPEAQVIVGGGDAQK